MDKKNNLAAAIQMTSGPHLADNLAQAEQLLEQAAQQGAVLAVLPEAFPLRGQGVELKRARMQIQEDFGHGPIQDFLAKTAKRLHMWIIGGTIQIKSDDPTRSYAACLVFNAQGDIVGRYDKLHLFDVTLSDTEVYEESDSVMPGNKIVVVQTPIGKVGLSVCYDMRFPELYRELLTMGAEVFAVPVAFTATTGKMHWDILTRALAVHHFCYVIAAGQAGKQVRETFGHSVIISPTGEILAQLPDGPGVVMSEIDLEKLAQYRKQIPALLHQRLNVEKEHLQKIIC